MKSKLLPIMLLCAAYLMTGSAQAQCAGPRYIDSVFTAYTITTVQYSVYGDSMDIYQPVGDYQATRPVVVLAHEGTFITGNRTSDPTVVRLCQDLVLKGYTTVSIDYRLQANPLLLENADSAALEVFEAVADAKAAVRYLYQDAYGANLYKVDTNNIFIGGNSAGAVLAMQYAYIDSISELAAVNPDYVSLVNSSAIGGLDGNSGNPGYSSNVKGVISLAGGLNSVSWLGYCSKPIVMAQGSADSVVPYSCGYPQVGVSVPLALCGLYSCAPSIVANTPYYDTLVFYGQMHVPWDVNPSMFYQVDTLVTGFLFQAVGSTTISPCNYTPAACNTWVPDGIVPVANVANIALYPNPASKELNITSSQFMTGISVSDEMGRTVISEPGINTQAYLMNTSSLSPGIYFVSINSKEGQYTSVRKIIIE